MKDNITRLREYLEMAEKNIALANTKENWQLWSQDTLDNVKAALVIVRCMDGGE
jgi:hypothetical protein